MSFCCCNEYSSHPFINKKHFLCKSYISILGLIPCCCICFSFVNDTCSSFASLSAHFKRFSAFQLLFHSHLLFVAHQESVENCSQCQCSDRVKVDCVFLDLYIITFSILFLNFTLIFFQVFLVDRNNRRMSKLLNRTQI